MFGAERVRRSPGSITDLVTTRACIAGIIRARRVINAWAGYGPERIRIDPAILLMGAATRPDFAHQQRLRRSIRDSADIDAGRELH